MPTDEFSFIEQYFSQLNPDLEHHATGKGLVLGIGDDAALVNMNGTYAITTDTLIENVHFFTNFNPFLLGNRTLDVNFSDLYAMGAQPQYVTLSLDIPDRYIDFDEFWEPFARGLQATLADHNCLLIGGNITHVSHKSAPLAISVTAFGKSYIEGKSLRRNQAKVGDLIVVTGNLGANGLYVKYMYNNAIRNLDSDAKKSFEEHAFNYDVRMGKFVSLLVKYSQCAIDVSDGLLGDISHILIQSKKSFEEHAFNYDVRMGKFVSLLVKYSQCAIDVSDGLLGDISHILIQSKVRALLNYESLPLDPISKSLLSEFKMSQKALLKLALSSGGDYNLVFTISKENLASLESELKAQDELRGFRITTIGEITEAKDYDNFNSSLSTDGGLITIVNNKCQEVTLRLGTGSYNHFIANY